MTTLEIILLIVIWLGYGIWAAYKTDTPEPEPALVKIFIVAGAPLVFIYRAIYGAFRSHKL